VGVTAILANPSWTITPRGNWKDTDGCFDLHSHNHCVDMNQVVPQEGFMLKCMWCQSRTQDNSKFHPDHCAPYSAVTTGAYAMDEMGCNFVRKTPHHNDGHFFGQEHHHNRHLLASPLELLLKGGGVEDPYSQSTPKMGGGSPKMGGGSPKMGGGSPKMGGGSPKMGGGSPKMGGGSPKNGGGSPKAGNMTACKGASASNPLACYNAGVQFLGGLAYGAVGINPTRVLKCAADINPIVTSLVAAFQNFHVSVAEVLTCVQALETTVANVKTAISDCNMSDLKQSLQSFGDHFKSILKSGITAGTILSHGVELYDVIDDAVHAATTGNLYEVGLDIGKVVNVIIGNDSANNGS